MSRVAGGSAECARGSPRFEAGAGLRVGGNPSHANAVATSSRNRPAAGARRIAVIELCTSLYAPPCVLTAPAPPVARSLVSGRRLTPEGRSLASPVDPRVADLSSCSECVRIEPSPVRTRGPSQETGSSSAREPGRYVGVNSLGRPAGSCPDGPARISAKAFMMRYAAEALDRGFNKKARSIFCAPRTSTLFFGESQVQKRVRPGSPSGCSAALAPPASIHRRLASPSE